MHSSTKYGIVFWVGITITIISVAFMASFGAIFDALLNNMLVIDPEGKMFDTYTAPDTPIFLDFYFFNVTNPDEVQRYGAKPVVVEKGPYRYLEKMHKFDYNFNHDEGTVEYRQNTTYFFDKDFSIGPETDKITTLNAVMVVLGSKLHDLSPALRSMGELFFLRFRLNDNLFITRTVSELLYQGYYDPLVKFLGKITGDPKQEEGKFGFYFKIIGAMGHQNRLIREVVWPEIEAGMNLIDTFTVGELTFQGWEQPTFNFDFSDVPFLGLDMTENLNGTLYDILKALHIDIPFLEANRIGLYLGQNGTDDGLYKVNTGEKGMDDYLHILEWEGESELPFWNDTSCNMINGTDGTQFPPGMVKEDTVVRLFTTDLCRSLYLEFEKKVKLHSVTLKRFVLTKPALKITPYTKCFCKDEFTCKDSMVNVKACKKGAPIVLSTPHFYQGDQVDVDNVEGLNPQKEIHETYLDIEPTTGVVMEAAKRIQLNLPLRKYGNLPAFQNVPEMIFPLFWASENAQIEQDDADSLQKTLTLPFIIVYVVCGLIILIGLIMIVIAVVKRKALKKNDKAGALLTKK